MWLCPDPCLWAPLGKCWLGPPAATSHVEADFMAVVLTTPRGGSHLETPGHGRTWGSGLRGRRCQGKSGGGWGWLSIGELGGDLVVSKGGQTGSVLEMGVGQGPAEWSGSAGVQCSPCLISLHPRSGHGFWVLEPQVCVFPSQLWKVKKALKMTVVWRGLRPTFQVGTPCPPVSSRGPVTFVLLQPAHGAG